VLSRRPAEQLAEADLRLVEAPLAPIGEGELRIRNLYLSLDPANRLTMSDRAQYSPPVGIGQVMRGVTLGVVEAVRAADFAPGDFVVTGEGGWQQYANINGRLARRIRPESNVALTAYLSVLGSKGLTAYFGLLDICAPAAGETMVVSAAAGAVGSIAGQIGKIKGCRVIGIAGGPEKCRWITEELGFDAAIDYKSQDVGQALRPDFKLQCLRADARPRGFRPRPDAASDHPRFCHRRLCRPIPRGSGGTFRLGRRRQTQMAGSRAGGWHRRRASRPYPAVFRRS
jgi:NADPH-dependent curcumin reductase CurA